MHAGARQCRGGLLVRGVAVAVHEDDGAAADAGVEGGLQVAPQRGRVQSVQQLATNGGQPIYLVTSAAAEAFAFNYDLATPPPVAEVGLSMFTRFIDDPSQAEAILTQVATDAEAAFKQ